MGDLDLEEMSSASRVLAVVEVIKLAKLFGQTRTAMAQRQFATMAEVSALKRLTEGKSYRFLTRDHLAALAPHRDPTTFPERCETADDLWDALGTSRQRVSELVKNFEALGEDFMGRAQEIGLGQPTLALACRLDKKGRERVIALAKNGSDKKELVAAVKGLAREAGALEAGKAAAEKKLAEREKDIEKGREQLKKAQAKARELRGEIADLRAGRALDPADREKVKAFGDEAARIRGWFAFLRGRLARFEDADIEEPLVMCLAALCCDEATVLFEELQGNHGIALPTGRLAAAIKRLAKTAHEAADAIIPKE